MSSPPISDEEHFESNRDNEEKTQLEMNMESLQVKEADDDVPNSEAERITRKEISSKNILSYTDFEAMQNITKCSSGEIQKRQERDICRTSHAKSPLTFQAKDEPVSRTEMSNWRSAPRTDCSGGTKPKQHVPVAQSSSWRDPNFQYERTNASRNWRSEDSTVSHRDGHSNRDRHANVSNRDETYSRNHNRSGSIDEAQFTRRNSDRSRIGNWTLSCASDIVLDNGLTEAEHVRRCVNELYEQNKKLFSKRPSENQTQRGGIKINLYTLNSEDKENVAYVADMLLEKIGDYPYCFYYFHGGAPIYMRTYEGELYEFFENNWRIIDFEKN